LINYKRKINTQHHKDHFQAFIHSYNSLNSQINYLKYEHQNGFVSNKKFLFCKLIHYRAIEIFVFILFHRLKGESYEIKCVLCLAKSNELFNQDSNSSRLIFFLRKCYVWNLLALSELKKIIYRDIWQRGHVSHYYLNAVNSCKTLCKIYTGVKWRAGSGVS
jgi:hypothetical protein